MSNGVRVEEERKVLLVERKYVGKVIGDHIEDGWEVSSSQPYTPPSGSTDDPPKDEVRIVLTRQHDINAP